MSSALGALFGGSRVLQAMARDKLLPIMKPFAYGSRRGDEPRIGVLFTWLIGQVSFLNHLDGESFISMPRLVKWLPSSPTVHTGLCDDWKH